MNTQLWLTVVNGALTTLLAIAVALIAYAQWQTAEKQRKQDIFEKRYEFYVSFLNCYIAYLSDTNAMEDTQRVSFINKAFFLFGKDIANHVETLLSKHDKRLNLDVVNSPFYRYMGLR